MTQDWRMDSMAMGKLFLPHMETLVHRIPRLEAALLCTADGFNVCSIGVTATRVGKMSALVSSLMSLGTATIDCATGKDSTVDSKQPSMLDTLILESGDTSIAGILIPGRVHLGLIVVAKKATFGVMLLGLRLTADQIIKVLPQDDAGVQESGADL